MATHCHVCTCCDVAHVTNTAHCAGDDGQCVCVYVCVCVCMCMCVCLRMSMRMCMCGRRSLRRTQNLEIFNDILIDGSGPYDDRRRGRRSLRITKNLEIFNEILIDWNTFGKVQN